MGKNDIILVHYGGETSPFLPLGTLYVANSLRNVGYSPRIIPSNINNIEYRNLLAEINPLYVGFSVFTFPQISEMINLSKITKESGFKVAWGGHHPTVLAEQCIQEPFVDYVITGEGEEISVEFSNQLKNGLNKSNLIFKAPSLIANLDEVSPALDLVDLNQYVSTLQSHLKRKYGPLKNLGYIITSRGCSSRCKFCGVHGIYNDGKRAVWNPHSPNFVDKQIQYIKSQIPDLESIIVWDDNFFRGNKNDSRSKEVLSLLKNENLRFNMEVRATFLKNKDNVKFLKENGCLQVFIGAESGSQNVLNLMRKGTKVEDYIIAAENCLEEDLPIRLSFFYGYPGETLSDILETQKFLERLNSYGPEVSVSGPKMYRPVPGTEGYIEAIQHGFKPPKNTEDWAKINSNTNPTLLPWLVEEATKLGVNTNDIYKWLNIRLNN
ncbi:MAG: B12-binding domain-containing radical SAM protein [bacterium]